MTNRTLLKKIKNGEKIYVFIFKQEPEFPQSAYVFGKWEKFEKGEYELYKEKNKWFLKLKDIKKPLQLSKLCKYIVAGDIKLSEPEPKTQEKEKKFDNGYEKVLWSMEHRGE